MADASFGMAKDAAKTPKKILSNIFRSSQTSYARIDLEQRSEPEAHLKLAVQEPRRAIRWRARPSTRPVANLTRDFCISESANGAAVSLALF
jgi:hypothetical protein